MKKIIYCCILSVVLFSTTGASVSTEFPQAGISNGLVQARFYLPDTANGYYRATRFDWAGVLPELEWNHHTYCAEWFDKYDPLINDAIMGPVESFMPLGYDSAAAGGRFVQPGVGVLSKPQDVPYSPFTYYPVLNYGSWKIKTSSSAIAFTHKLQEAPYGYTYTKTTSLVKGKPILLLQHHLTNTGTQTITTSVYNHNLFLLDGQPTGAGAVVTFPFVINASAENQKGLGEGNIAYIKDSQLIFTRQPEKREYLYCILNGYRNNAADYDIRIENHHTGAALRITCDQPISRLALWGSSRIFSPEPFIQLTVAPGKTVSWEISYELYECKKY